jgi:hypothetical protein
MHLNHPSVQMFLGIRLPIVRPTRPFFPDPRTKLHSWRKRTKEQPAHTRRRSALVSLKIDDEAA